MPKFDHIDIDEGMTEFVKTGERHKILDLERGRDLEYPVCWSCGAGADIEVELEIEGYCSNIGVPMCEDCLGKLQRVIQTRK